MADDDLDLYMQKAREYGSADLKILGLVLAEWLEIPPKHAEELGIAFYVLGKVARMVGAYREGRLPSLDTLRDTNIYVMMMRLERLKGGK